MRRCPWVRALILALAAASVPAVRASASVSAAPPPPHAAVGRGPDHLLAAICYHRFGPETAKDPYRISLKRLAGELRWLRAHGWQGVTLAQVGRALDGDAGALPPKAVLLTVDDGYRAGAAAAPVFRRYGYRAVFFVVPSVLGRGAFLSYADLRRLEREGFQVASHTLTHPDLAKVPRGLDPTGYARWVRRELGEPKRMLEEALGHPVTALAWPYGAYNPAIAAEALRLGYRQLWSVSGGLNDDATLDRSRLRRIILIGHPSLGSFARRLELLPLKPFPGGIHEGALYYRSSLPLRVDLPPGARAVLGGRPVTLDRRHGFWIGAGLKNGFHYLNVAEADHGIERMTPFLFQVAPDAWRPCFEALEAPQEPPRALLPDGGGASGAAPERRP